MEVAEKQIYNLWDTNGRRSDILNALSLYLSILKEMKDSGDFDQWASFPNSLTQLSFYKKAIEQSPEVFKKHPLFDSFIGRLELDVSENLNKQKLNKLLEENPALLSTLDKAIEQRARHYTSNLVRFGFATDNRTITPAGQSFINGKIERDQIERCLPFNDINILFLRQLMKLRIFTKSKDGKRTYYSPFFVSVYLLLKNDCLDKEIFSNIVQGLNPYLDVENATKDILNNDLAKLIDNVSFASSEVPIDFLMAPLVKRDTFNANIKNRKSGDTVLCYYDFYQALYKFRRAKDRNNFETLRDIYLTNKEKLRKAFCLGKNVFDFGPSGSYDLESFLDKNSDNPFFKAEAFNRFFYESYQKSKNADAMLEYFDTTMRALGASGLFKFKPNVRLFNKEVIDIVFKQFDFSKSFFDEVNDEEYQKYESGNCNTVFGSNMSMVEILHYSDDDIAEVISDLLTFFGSSTIDSLRWRIETNVGNQFRDYVESNYPKSKVIALLGMISDRNNDDKLKSIVCPSATIPTIYEYLIGIAWYYISNRDFDLYSSFNMTLNGDFEPEMHAGSGVGDIVINYPNRSVLLEVTLMNKAAQKRGEWEPVLRHSLNNKADHLDVETLTFFVADELDFNTINIWRAVAAVPLRSTNGDVKEINGVVIMPFKNTDIIKFLADSVRMSKIIGVVKESFAQVPKITDGDWHEKVIEQIQNSSRD